VYAAPIESFQERSPRINHSTLLTVDDKYRLDPLFLSSSKRALLFCLRCRSEGKISVDGVQIPFRWKCFGRSSNVEASQDQEFILAHYRQRVRQFEDVKTEILTLVRFDLLNSTGDVIKTEEIWCVEEC
jgi:hypothetical protein